MISHYFSENSHQQGSKSTELLFLFAQLEGEKAVSIMRWGGREWKAFYAEQHCTVQEHWPSVHATPDLICNFLSHVP